MQDVREQDDVRDGRLKGDGRDRRLDRNELGERLLAPSFVQELDEFRGEVDRVDVPARSYPAGCRKCKEPRPRADIDHRRSGGDVDPGP